MDEDKYYNKYYNELDDYERRIEGNTEKFSKVENIEYWKKVIERAAKNTLRKRRMFVLSLGAKRIR